MPERSREVLELKYKDRLHDWQKNLYEHLARLMESFASMASSLLTVDDPSSRCASTRDDARRVLRNRR
jgi:hypothetical protein